MGDDTKGKGLRGGLTHYGDAGFSWFLRRSFAKSMGLSDEAMERPVIGIAATPSGFNNCHRTVPELVEAVKRGVMVAGGLPVEFPTISLGEPYLAPTSMLFRNLMAIDTEEMVRAQPMDGVVLVGGCDKTVPAQLMGAASAGLPAIQLVTGPTLTGSWRGERLGACPDCRRQWGRYRAGELDDEEIPEVGGQLSTTAGTCMVMGTASTMALMVEALGMMLPGGAAIPAVHADRLRIAEATGKRAVAMIGEGLTPDKVMTSAAFANALRILHATGGSTNGLVHIAAIAGRLASKSTSRRSTAWAARPRSSSISNHPAATTWRDLFKAGGLAPILRELRPLLNLDCLTVTGRSAGPKNSTRHRRRGRKRWSAPSPHPWRRRAALRCCAAIWRPIARSSSSPPPRRICSLTRAARWSSTASKTWPAASTTRTSTSPPDDVLVLRNAGPIGAPGMPESGYVPIPKKLAQAGVKDMVRISDARMSGTAFGAIVLHAAPEAATGGPLALVENGDRIRLDVPGRRLELLVDDETLAARRAAWTPPPAHAGADRGWLKLHLETVEQADKGCDLGFLKPQQTRVTPGG